MSAEMGYAHHGLPDKVPPNTGISFIVELLHITKKPKKPKETKDTPTPHDGTNTLYRFIGLS